MKSVLEWSRKYVLLTPGVVNVSNDNMLSLPHGDNGFFIIKVSLAFIYRHQLYQRKWKCKITIQLKLKQLLRLSGGYMHASSCILKNPHYFSTLFYPHIFGCTAAEIGTLIELKHLLQCDFY